MLREGPNALAPAAPRGAPRMRCRREPRSWPSRASDQSWIPPPSTSSSHSHSFVGDAARGAQCLGSRSEPPSVARGPLVPSRSIPSEARGTPSITPSHTAVRGISMGVYTPRGSFSATLLAGARTRAMDGVTEPHSQGAVERMRCVGRGGGAGRPNAGPPPALIPHARGRRAPLGANGRSPGARRTPGR